MVYGFHGGCFLQPGHALDSQQSLPAADHAIDVGHLTVIGTRVGATNVHKYQAWGICCSDVQLPVFPVPLVSEWLQALCTCKGGCLMHVLV